MKMENNSRRKNVVLFKAVPSENLNDRYVEVLKAYGVTATVIPTLAFNFINEDILQMHLRNVSNFSGFIFTSPRAVEAVYRIFCSSKDMDATVWSKKMNFSVGESTSTSAKTLLNMDTIGGDSGNSEQLCQLITTYFEPACQKTPLLFPCSSTRKDTVPDILSNQGIAIEEIICYETVCNPSMKQCWENLMSKQGLPEILGFFSPSTVKYANELLEDINPRSHYSKIKFVAIGPSTEKALSEKNLIPYCVAEKPNPESVLEAIKKFL